MADDPLDLEGRRLALMRQAAADMSALPAGKRTLDEFERRTAAIATQRQWHNAGFLRQHTRHHPDLAAVYQAARFPERDPSTKPPRGAKTATGPELVRALAEAEEKLKAETSARREAEDRAARARVGNAADLVREFIRQMRLTPKGDGAGP